LALCDEHGFAEFGAVARVCSGWARAQLGSAEEGVAVIRQGINGRAEIGTRSAITDFLKRLAEAQSLAGATIDALATIEDALTANPEELVARPDGLCCRGELRLTLDQSELAEADFRDAIALARTMHAKAFELRATTRLARLLAHQGQRDEERALLAEIYAWFTEGFDTRDLTEAKALLDELATSRS
jgi:predicted ATPase